MIFIYKKFIPALLSLIVVTILLCLPSSALPKTGGNWFYDFQVDKIIHIGIFAFLVFMFCRPIRLKGFFNGILTKIYFFIAVLFSIYGLVIEFVQKWWIPGRGFEGMDIVADVVGCFIGYFVAKRVLQKVKQPTQEEMKSQLMDYARQFVKK